VLSADASANMTSPQPWARTPSVFRQPAPSTACAVVLPPTTTPTAPAPPILPAAALADAVTSDAPKSEVDVLKRNVHALAQTREEVAARRAERLRRLEAELDPQGAESEARLAQLDLEAELELQEQNLPGTDA